jgi:hypothetical protein
MVYAKVVIVIAGGVLNWTSNYSHNAQKSAK